jgi:MFS family permease
VGLRQFFSGYDLRLYGTDVHRFFLFALPLFSGLSLFSLLYNLYLLRLHFNEDFIGQLVGIMPLATGLCAIPTGLLSDRFGRKPFLIAASLLMGTGQLGLCLARDPAWLLAFSFISGIAAAFVYVNFIPYLAEYVQPERRGQALSLWTSIQVLTRLLLSLAGGVLPGAVAYMTDSSTAVPEPFRWVLLGGAALSFLAVWPLLGISRPQTVSGAEAGKTGRVPWKPLVAFAFISGLRGLAQGLSFPFFNVFFQEQFHATAAGIGFIFFASQMVGLPSTLAAPAAEKRWGPRRTVLPLRIAGAACMVALGSSGAMGWAVVFFLGATAMEAMTMPIEMNSATRALPRRYWARIQSMRVTGFQLLSGLGSVSAGYMVVEYGYWLPFSLAAVALVGSATVFALAFEECESEKVA